MTENQKNLVKKTVPILKEHGVLLTSHFYKRMFEHNPELKNVFNMGNQQNNKQQTALAMAVLAYAEHIEDPSVLLPVVNNIGHKHTSLNIKPVQYAIVGKHLIASIKEVLGDAATDDLLEAWSQAYFQLANLMIGHEQGLYDQKAAQEGGWLCWRPFIVKQKVKESEEITSFYLYPSDGEKVANFQPGQYISLRIFLPELNLLQPRQYSISCAPNGKYYRISVKRELGNQHPDGMISNRLHQFVQEGDVLEISAPSGTFVLNNDTNRSKVFISGGVGQTPLLSMLEELITRNDTESHSITWIHGCREESVHAFKSRINEIEQNTSTFKKHIFYDQQKENTNEVITGWVDLSVVKNDVLLSGADFYICGPSPFINKHYEFLINNGIPKQDIYFEEFGPASLQLN